MARGAVRGRAGFSRGIATFRIVRSSNAAAPQFFSIRERESHIEKTSWQTFEFKRN
jgi:hypothetical protein